MKNQIKIFIFLILFTTIIYPQLIYISGNIFWKEKVNGSIISKDNVPVASSLIGQEFTSDKWFHGRPSSIKYNAESSAATNYAPTNQDFAKIVTERKSLGLENEMLFNSGSGLDPHISRESALQQVKRISLARGLNNIQDERLKQFVYSSVEKREWGFLGQDKLNFIILNATLEKVINAN